MIRSKILNNFSAIDHSFYDASESKSESVNKLLKEAYFCQQIHQNIVSIAGKKLYYPGCDGIISANQALMVIRTADCLPIFLYSQDKHIIAALHAGWRSLLMNIIYNYYRLLNKANVDWDRVFVSIGPHIGKCCYEVSKSLIDKFSQVIKNDTYYYEIREGNYYLHLGAIAKYQLNAIGIPLKNIEDVNICTSCKKNFNSYRRNQTKERNYSFLRLK